MTGFNSIELKEVNLNYEPFVIKNQSTFFVGKNLIKVNVYLDSPLLGTTHMEFYFNYGIGFKESDLQTNLEIPLSNPNDKEDYISKINLEYSFVTNLDEDENNTNNLLTYEINKADLDVE